MDFFKNWFKSEIRIFSLVLAVWELNWKGVWEFPGDMVTLGFFLIFNPDNPNKGDFEVYIDIEGFVNEFGNPKFEEDLSGT